MENESVIAIIIVISIFCLALIISGVTMITSDVIGANITNDTTVAKVFVWNTEPNISSVVISPSPIDLTPGNTTQVNCTGYVWDWNGWQDIKFINATFYHSSVNNDDGDDNNNHYHNGTGNCEQDGSSDTNATCLATFNVWYYANDGTWTCNMTIADQGRNITDPSRNITFNRSNDASVTVNTVLALNAPDEIDYGNLSVTEESNEIPANISNWGNVPINISVRGWGGTGNLSQISNTSCMICDLGNISLDYERYTITSGTDYNSMTNITYNSTGISNFALSVRTNDTNYGNDTNTTYWKIEIPYTVGGYCNGTIEFSATDTT